MIEILTDPHLEYWLRSPYKYFENKEKFKEFDENLKYSCKWSLIFTKKINESVGFCDQLVMYYDADASDPQFEIVCQNKDKFWIGGKIYFIHERRTLENPPKVIDYLPLDQNVTARIVGEISQYNGTKAITAAEPPLI